MRGIYATIYINFKGKPEDNFLEIYNQFYQDSPNVSLMAEGEIPEILKVSKTNKCQIGIYTSAIENQIVVISAIDNLVKGAAGQAIQNMNLMFDMPENEGLEQLALYP